MLLERAKTELGQFGRGGVVRFPKDKMRAGDFTLKTALKQLDEVLVDPKVDVVWAFGLLASAAAVQRATTGRLRKPVVAPFVLSSASGPLEKLDGARSNLSYVVLTPPLTRDLKALRAIRPIRHVAYLLPQAVRAALPRMEPVLRSEAKKVGVRLHFASGADPRAVVMGLPADIDAVYVGPDPRRTPELLSALVAALVERRLPSFSQLGRPEVEQGLLMGLGGIENGTRLARAVAVNTDAILQGEPAGTLSYAFQQVEDLVVNRETARRLGLALSWAVLSEADLLGPSGQKEARQLNLQQVVEEVRERNLTLRANKEELEAARQSVREAFGALLPALDASVSGVWSDPDGATPVSPERRLSWSGDATQVVLNEPALARLTINKHLQDATGFDNRAAILDTVRDAAVAYLEVLRSRVTEQVQRDNLKVTRTELSQARLRKRLGKGTQSEVVRLETQLATNQRNVIDAVASRNVREIELLRLLNLASEERFVPEDVSLESSALMRRGERLQRYLGGPERFRVLREFMGREALENAPELKASARRLAAQQRQALSQKLAPFLPQISLSAGVTHQFATGGEGDNPSPETQAIFQQNPVNWQVAVNANLRLWEGNARYARIRQEQATARGQALDLEARRIQIEANIRGALHRAGAAFAAIRLQNDAAAAADENLVLVQEAYASGKRDIISLVDAQNQALTARLNANTAIYDFLIDLLDVQRAMGRFDLLMSDAEVDGFFERLQTFAVMKEASRE